MSHYDTLGVGRRAQAAEIAAAATSLRAAVVLDHDRDHYMLAAIDEAEFVLSDPDRRRVYDRTLASGRPTAAATASAAIAWPRLAGSILAVVPAAVVVGCVVWLLTRDPVLTQVTVAGAVVVGVLGVVAAAMLVAVRARSGA